MLNKVNIPLSSKKKVSLYFRKNNYLYFHQLYSKLCSNDVVKMEGVMCVGISKPLYPVLVHTNNYNNIFPHYGLS